MAREARPWFRKQIGWWCAYIGGREVRLARGVGKAAKTEASKRLKELLALRNANPSPESKGQTIASIIDLYLSFARKRLAPRTYEEREHYLQAFAEHCGFRAVAACRAYDLTAWLDSNSQWQSDWTISSIVAIVQRPFNWAVSQGLVEKNPFKGVRKTQGEPRRPITEDEFRALLRASAGKWRRMKPTPGARFRQVLLFLRYTGCRPGEAAKLRWADIDLDNAVIVLRKHKTAKTRKKKTPRIVPLHPIVLRLLIWLRRRAEHPELVFLTHRRTAWNRSNLSLRVQRARKKAGIAEDATLYGIRHSFGTRSILNGVDLKTLAELMGHTTTRMTEHYVHLAGQRSHLAAAMLRANAKRPGS